MKVILIKEIGKASTIPSTSLPPPCQFHNAFKNSQQPLSSQTSASFFPKYSAYLLKENNTKHPRVHTQKPLTFSCLMVMQGDDLWVNGKKRG